MDKSFALLVEKIEQLGAVVTEKAIEGIEFLWPLAIKQVYIHAVSEIIAGLLLFGVGVSILLFCWMQWKAGNCELDDTGGLMIISMVSLVVAAVLLFNGVPKFFNTDFYALQVLSKMIK